MNSNTHRWLLPLLFACFFAGVTVAIWFALDHVGVALRQAGWPFSSVLSLALINAIGGGVIGRAYHTRLLQRAASRADPVEENESDADNESDANESGVTVNHNLPAMPLFADCVTVERRRKSTDGGAEFEVFDLTTESSNSDGDMVRIERTVALFHTPGLPQFELRPRGFHHRLLALAGVSGLEFSRDSAGTADGREVVARFASAYRVTLAPEETLIASQVEVDEMAVRRVFPLKSMATLLKRTDWHLESHGGHLACWVATDPLGPKRRAALVNDAAELRSILLAAVEGKAGEPLDAPPGVAPLQRQAARLQATLLGGVGGAFAGFFTAGMLRVSEVIDQDSMAKIFPLATVAGALLGATLGRLLPLRRPLLRQPKDKRLATVVGMAAVAGLLGGFIAGGVSGAIIGELMQLKIDDHKQRALLFFGGIGVGSVLGAVGLGTTAHYLYLWILGHESRR